MQEASTQLRGLQGTQQTQNTKAGEATGHDLIFLKLFSTLSQPSQLQK
jgi:hypothetical protein